jgi:circadian clock protein KaiB
MQRSQTGCPTKARARRPPAAGPAAALTLYVADQAPRSVLAIRACTALCEMYRPGRVTLEIIDLYRHPGAAKRDGIVAVPTLIRSRPLPVRTLIGTLTDPAQVLARLDLTRPAVAPRKDHV